MQSFTLRAAANRSPADTAPPAPPGRTRAARRARRTAAALLAATTAGCLLAAAAPQPGPAPLGIGDRLYPYLGNPGYDVRSYDIALTYRANDRPLAAVTRIDARATERLTRFNLDFTHGTVQSVDVNGAPAGFATAGEDLVVTPEAAVERGDRLHITVRHTSNPVPAKDKDNGWLQTRDGLAMANQASAAHAVFPCNDHPSDKAYFTFRVNVPRTLVAVAGGSPAGTARHGATTTWTYRTAHPMATELAQVSIGRSAVIRRKGPHGLPVRDVVPAAYRKALEPTLKKTPGEIAWMEKRVGPYPFERYGVLVADAQTGFELETQTLSLFEKELFLGNGTLKFPTWYVDSVMVHELSHQWFGDSVSPARWSDVWLNEAHATWYEALYAQDVYHHSMEQRLHTAYLQSDDWRTQDGPPAAPKPPDPGKKIDIFRPMIYDGSALVLYALQQKIGAPAFERLERAWVREHRDGSASTADFVRLASRIAGRDLTGFLHPWLYGATTPPMPGHPTWRTEATRKAEQERRTEARKQAGAQGVKAPSATG